MAKTNAERQRDWRARRREKRGTIAMIPAAQHEAVLTAWKDEARRWGEARKAEAASLREMVTGFQDEITRLEAHIAELAAGTVVPPCRQCGGELACPACYRTGGDW